MNRLTGVGVALVVMGVAGLVLTSFNWSGKAEPTDPPKRERFADDRLPPLKDMPSEAKRDEFAADRTSALKPVPFDGKRAMGYLEELCKIGPRISGSDGMRQQQELLRKHFEKLGADVTFQRWEARQPSQEKPVPMANLIASWHKDRKRRVILCGHYDTRPIADEEPNRRNWRKPFVSANDGTSTAAWMMELAHHMKDLKLEVGVDFVLFDGEEFINDKEKGDRYFLGSEHFAQLYRKEKPPYQYTAGVLLDLFAGKGAIFPVEANSFFLAGAVAEEIWSVAKQQGVDSFLWERGPEILDDHIALNKAGIPTVDVIDFGYKHWHRLSDLPEQCSADGMAQMAKVLTVWLQARR